MSSTVSERQLYDIASRYGGFFTAKQAAMVGYAAPKRNYHVRAGNWVREQRGIFRLKAFPLPDRSDLVLWWLWSRNRQDEPQGIFSHQTALSLHELTDLMPSRIHMTVPPGFRRSAKPPKSIVLHQAELQHYEMENIAGVPTTNALRTLLDLALTKDVESAELRTAFVAAVKSGKITRAQLSQAEKDSNWTGTLQALQGRSG